MDLRKCQVVLQDDRVLYDRHITSETGLYGAHQPAQPTEGGLAPPAETVSLNVLVQGLLKVFENGVHVVRTGSACLAKIIHLDTQNLSTQQPILVLVPVATDAPLSKGHLSRSSTDLDPIPQGIVPKDVASGVRGLELLKHISEDHHVSKLVVPIAFLHRESALEPGAIVKFLEAGAKEILIGVDEQHLQALAIVATHAFLEGKRSRPAFLTKKQRKISWVGVQEDKPYAHLREQMVSKLMQSICQPQTDVIVVPTTSTPYTIPPERLKFVQETIGNWRFPAHDLNYDELTEAGVLMLKHALTMPELEAWNLADDEIRRFMLDCRSAYNDFVLYHNFRHVIDVLQAVFSFLIAVGALPKYPYEAGKKNEIQSPIATLIRPFDAFVLLITAIGHDVGHPGVNNAFLVSIKAPLAQLYNDNSVLEAFHCAAYSQILRRYWPAVYENVNIRQLLIKSILATDMQLHFKYMADLGNLQEKLAHNKGIDGWNDKILDDYRNLACGLLIKCADISNLARPFEIAETWTDILQLEFARQGEMEKTVGIETTLFGGPPELGNVTKLANSQIGFMNIFALPLFESVTDILPPMKFTVNQIKANQEVWKQRIEQEKLKEIRAPSRSKEEQTEGWQSPRSASPQRTTFSGAESMSHPEGLPASGSDPHEPQSPPMNTTQGTPDVPDFGSSVSPVASQHSNTKMSLVSGTTTASNVSSPVSVVARGDPVGAKQEASKPQQQHYSRMVAHAISTEDLSGVVVQPRSTNGWPPPPSRVISETELPPTSRLSNGNFSRPMSQRHSSATRSSAPSAAVTAASSFSPTSPTETQATSLLERGSDSSLSTEDNRPSSGYSGAVRGSSGHSSGFSSYSRGTNGHAVEPQATHHYTKNSNGHIVEHLAIERGNDQKALKSKRSRSRFFPPLWFSKKNRSVEVVQPEQK